MTKKLFATILALLLLLPGAPAAQAAEHWDWDTDGHFDISWYSRAGRSFTLTTAEQLAGLAWIVNEGIHLQLPGEPEPQRESFTGKTVRLAADIYLNERPYSDESAEAHKWPSIGGGTQTLDNAVYNGTFDGQGHTVWNMYIHDLSPWQEYGGRNRGFFGITAENAVIENLTLRDGYIRAARSTGGIVGKIGYLNEDPDDPTGGYDASLSGHGSIIRNCHNVNTAVTTTDSKGAGGIVGACWNYATVQNCSNSGAISCLGAYPAGGIAGENEYVIEGCYNTGAIFSGANNAGGIVGSNKLAISEIRDCYNTGEIRGTYAGGLSGFQVGKSSNSYSIGAVSGKNAGGLFGELKSGVSNTNLYYLSSIAAGAAGLSTSGSADAKGLPAGAVQSPAMPGSLGGAFATDGFGINGAFPILAWQRPPASAQASGGASPGAAGTGAAGGAAGAAGTGAADGTVGAGIPDVSADAWYAVVVQAAMAKGLFDLGGDGAFSPEAPMTRAMLALALHRLEGSPAPSAASPFPDAQAPSVAWANEAGVVSGMGDGTFAPDAPITREQIAAMLARYLTYKGRDTGALGDLSAFSDAALVSPWALEAMGKAVGQGLIGGMGGGLLAPQGTATRAQVAAILTRLW
jgi:Spy/CpxP family protein refolding chaperone